ncbi:MAG: PqqD family protein [Proteobacteria bacterium]|nr:PqqD family protein [Pseudomonadota bacterium]
MSLSPLSSDFRVVRGKGLIEAEVDGELVALHIDKGVCYGLNKVGSRVWQLIETPAKIGDVCAALTSEFDVDAATCEREVLDLLEELRAEGLIEVRG